MDGLPEDHPLDDAEIPPEEVRVRGAGITMPNCKAPRDVKRAVARLHVNLGHPSSADLIRMISQQGTVNPDTIAAAKALNCTSCLRMKNNAPARPSRVLTRFMGQLGDCVQMDIFYARTVDGQNHAMLGIVDEATNLQQVSRLPNREPTSVLKAFREVWVRPYGMPHKVTMDQDGAFMGEFWTYLVDQATEADYVPPEAHHRLGKAERCNTVYREILNRVVDGMAIATTDDMEKAVDATTHAINSMPRTRGLSAYAIVFGRVPRVPGELLTDEAALAADVPMEEHNRHAILFRAEAQKAAAQVNVDQHVRRALLRKTAHMRVQDIAPGAKCAVWRSQLRGKGPKKKGGYVIGRLVTFDGRCAWVQLGTQTVKVDRNQLRPAYGFESWAPDAEDIQALKDAEKNLLDGNVHSLEGPPPPDDEPLEPDVIVPPTPQTTAILAPSTPALPPTPMPLERPASPRARQGKRYPKEVPSSASDQKRLATEEEWEGGQLSNLVCHHDDLGLTHEIELREPGWDGSEWQPSHQERLVNLPEVFASEHAAPPLPCDQDEIEDSHTSWKVCYIGDQKALVNTEKLTRKEMKALNREVPWREIVRQGGV